MIAKLLKMLAGFIVDEAFDRLGIKDVDDLLGKAAVAFKAELGDDLAKIETLPEQITTAVTNQVNGIIAQVTAAVTAALKNLIPSIPGLPNIFGR